MVTELLTQLGLTEKETLIYLAILQLGKATPSAISRKTKVNRTTVYSVAKELIKKGLITEDLGSMPSVLVALPPQNLREIVSRQEREIKEKANIIDKLVPELFSFSQETQYSIPRIKFTTEEDLTEYMKKQRLVWDEAIKKYDNTMWGFQDETFAEHYKGYIDWHWNNVMTSNDMKLRILANKTPIEENLAQKGYERREIKYWKGAQGFTASTWVWGDYIIMAVTNQRPHYIVEIYDSVLAHNMRELFKGIWDSVE